MLVFFGWYIITFLILLHSKRIIRFKQHCLKKNQTIPRFIRILSCNALLQFIHTVPMHFCSRNLRKTLKTVRDKPRPFLEPCSFQFFNAFSDYRNVGTLYIIERLVIFKAIKYLRLLQRKTEFIRLYIHVCSYSFIDICIGFSECLLFYVLVHTSNFFNISSLKSPAHIKTDSNRKSSYADIIDGYPIFLCCNCLTNIKGSKYSCGNSEHTRNCRVVDRFNSVPVNPFHVRNATHTIFFHCHCKTPYKIKCTYNALIGNYRNSLLTQFHGNTKFTAQIKFNNGLLDNLPILVTLHHKRTVKQL